ncbi:6688_t:CDS:10 [Ambispora gerdemannii]|uniref:6688_t:CDS:1 n=1 Tax=Ambispora gerdemannii TaxID=144530 RepID=A0A9N9ANP8_9GLOM|nr:6688_t:CDS:10 [Ambispora gerdemannii]
MSITEEKATWSTYFDVTPPEDYSFLGFYEHRSKQADFISSFQKESHKLKKELVNLIKDGSNEMKKGASRLEKIRRYCMLGCNDLSCRKEPTQLRVASACCPPNGLRGHRKYFEGVSRFWNQIERRRAEFEASSSIIQNTTEVFKTSAASVNSSIKNVNDTILKYNEELNGVESALGKRRDSENYEENRILKKRQNRCTTPPPREDHSLMNTLIGSSKFSESSQLAVFVGGIPNYEEGVEIDPELAVQETDEAAIPYFERSFDHNSWKSWTLRSGSVVVDLLKKASRIKGHPLRPEVWSIIRCGFKIAKPKWCNDKEYAEIQSFTRRPSLTSPPKHIMELLKRQKSLESLGFEIKKFKRDKLNTDTYFLEEITSRYSDEEKALFSENIKITCSTPYFEDSFTTFFMKILSLFHKYVFIDDSIIQQPGVSEANYGGYVIHPCLKKIHVDLEDCLHYHMGEAVLSSVKSCRSRRKSINSYEQKSDGIFFVKLKKALIEVGHLEMSGGHGHKDIPRSTWDGCCKLPIGNSFMLEEIGEQFRGGSPETFSKLRVWSLHTYEDRIELWQMHNPACGVLQYERSHKSIVPICYEGHRKHIFDFVVLLWDFKCGLLETFNIILQLQDENNDNLFESSKLSGSLPAYPFTPSKDKHKIGIQGTNKGSDPDSSPIRSYKNDNQNKTESHV